MISTILGNDVENHYTLTNLVCLLIYDHLLVGGTNVQVQRKSWLKISSSSKLYLMVFFN